MGVRSRVADAMASVPRSDFLPADLRDRAHEDVPFGIGHGATNSQPSTVAAMLELLDPQTGDRVLDVGAGSGWTTALLAHLVGADGRVLGVELVPELAAAAAELLARRGVATATVETARPGVLGAPDRAPFDRILVSAMARTVPDGLVDQLADGGRLVVPVQGRMLVVGRLADRITTTMAPGYYRFVPLR